MDIATLGLKVDSKSIPKAMQELDRFGDKADQVERQTVVAMDSIGASIRSMAAPLAGILGGAFAVDGLLDQARLIGDSNVLAQTLEMSTGKLQEWQFAGEQVGISAEKMGDIFKDASDKIGDFTANGGGEAADLFKNLNINMAELQRLSPDEQLLKMGEAISQLSDPNQRVTYMEMLADDASRLLPLLKDGAAELQRYSEEARSLGIAMEQEDIERVLEANRAMRELRMTAQGLSNEFLVQFGPGIGSAIEGLTDFISEGGGAEEMIDTLTTVATGLALVYGGRLAGGIQEKTAAMIKDVAQSQRTIAVEAKQLAMTESNILMQKRREEADLVRIRNEAKKAQQIAATNKVEAAAQLDSVKFAQQRLVLDRQEEQRRLKAQISDRGRQQSLTRLAEIRRAEMALEGQAVTSSKALTAATAAEASATRTLTASKVDLAKASAATDAAMIKSAAASKAAATSFSALAVAGRAASGAIGLLGGPVGAVITAVTAFALLAPEIETSRDRINDLQDKADDGAKALEKLSDATHTLSIESRKAAIDELTDQLDEQRKAAEEARLELARLRVEQAKNTPTGSGSRLDDTRSVSIGAINKDLAAVGDASDKLEKNVTKAKEQLRRMENGLASAQAQQVRDKAAEFDAVIAANERYYRSVNETMALEADMATKRDLIAKADRRRIAEIDAGGTSYAKLKGEINGVAKANNDYYKTISEISKANLTLAQRQELITEANNRRVVAVKKAADAERAAAAELQYKISAHDELLGQYSKIQQIQNDYVRTMREIASAEMSELQRKQLLLRADQDRVKALQNLKQEQVDILAQRIQGGQDTGAVNMDFINRKGEHAPDLKSSELFEQSARRISDSIESGNLNPKLMAQSMEHLQTMVGRYSASGENFDIKGMQGAINNLAAQAKEAFGTADTKPMTAAEYEAVFKAEQDKKKALEEKQVTAYDTIVAIDQKLAQLNSEKAAKEPQAMGKVELTVYGKDGSTKSGTVTGPQDVIELLKRSAAKVG